MNGEERILVLGDIHANDAALAAVLQDYGGTPVIWFLGDLFGRGPQPARAYRRLLGEQPEAMIAGNHEGGLVGHYGNVDIGGRQTGPYNRADWTVLMEHRASLCARGLLDCEAGAPVGGEVFDWIARLPVICAPRPSIYLVHGGLERPFRPPDELAPFFDHLVWGYANSATRAEYTLEAIRWVAAHRPADPRIVLAPGRPAAPELVIVGHWHARLLYDSAGQWHYPPALNRPYDLVERTVLLSPGSVGFPRENGDLDASYCVLTLRDSRPFTVEFRRCAYDRRAVRQEMARKRYPEETIKRLRLPGETETPARGLADAEESP